MWKIVAVAAVIVVIYQQVVIRALPEGGHAHDQGQDNVIRAQKLIYGHADGATVLVGSSKLARVDFGAASGIVNLAFAGKGALTGLAVLRRAQTRPRRVVIEVGDTIVNEADAAFLESLFDPVNHALRRRLPVLRDAYQPGAIVDGLALALAAKRGMTPDGSVRPDVFEQLLRSAEASHASEPTAQVMARVVRALRQEVDALHARGVSVIFVEPPEHPTVWASPLCRRIRRELQAAFPEGEVRWFPLSDPGAYQTIDGLHLDHAAAERFASALTRFVAAQP